MGNITTGGTLTGGTSNSELIFGQVPTNQTTQKTSLIGLDSIIYPKASSPTPLLNSQNNNKMGVITTANGTTFNTVPESFPFQLKTPMMYGDGIKRMQTALNKTGASLEVHGIFGSATKTALINFQKSKGLGADGVYGNCSRYYLEGVGSCSTGGGTKASTNVTAAVPEQVTNDINSYATESKQEKEAAPRPTIFGMPQELFWGLGLGVFLVIGFLMATKYRVFEAKKIVI